MSNKTGVTQPAMTFYFVPRETEVVLTKNLTKMLDYVTKRDQWFVLPLATPEHITEMQDYRQNPMAAVFHQLTKYERDIKNRDLMELQIDSHEFYDNMWEKIKGLIGPGNLIFRDETDGSAYLMIVPSTNVSEIHLPHDQLQRIYDGDTIETVVQRSMPELGPSDIYAVTPKEPEYTQKAFEKNSELIERWLRENEFDWDDLVNVMPVPKPLTKEDMNLSLEYLKKIADKNGLEKWEEVLTEVMPDSTDFQKTLKTFEKIWKGTGYPMPGLPGVPDNVSISDGTSTVKPQHEISWENPFTTEGGSYSNDSESIS